MTIILLISKAGIYPIIHVCISISDQLLCKIKLVSFWVHLNGRPNYVIFENLSLNNHAYVSISVFINFPKPDLIGPVKDSWGYMLSSLIPR